MALTGYTNVVSVDGVGATVEKGEPNPNVTLQNPSVWYSWTAPAVGTANIYAGGGAVEYFDVFTGTQLNHLRRVVAAGSSLTFEAKAGQVYQIQAMSFYGQDFSMHVELATRPGNDDFTNRFQLEGTIVSTNGNTAAATREPAEPRHNGLRFGRSVWYSWTAPADGWLFVDLTNSPQLLCEPYTGNTIRRLRPANGILLNSDPFSGVLPVSSGMEYQLAVDGQFYYAKVVHSGPFNLNLEFSGLTLFAPTNNSVFTGPSQLELSATDAIPNFDGIINEVTFYASNVISGQETAIGQSSGPSFDFVWNNPTNGYFFLQARGTNDQNRVVRSNPSIIAIRPSNDDFANRIVLQGADAAFTADFAAATRVKSDPSVAKILNDDFDGATLWWTWTAPADGTVALNCDNWTIAMAVYTGKSDGLKDVMKPCWTSGQFQAKEGQTYQILLSDRYPVTAPSHGNVTLTLQ